MKRLMVGTAILIFLLATNSYAQSGAAVLQADAGHESQASCVILKRIGRVGRAQSRLYSLGISGKQFRYVEGKLPEGLSFHGKMTNHDVRKLQARGAEVLVLESHYTPEDLKEARAHCPGEAGKTPNPAETKASPAQAPPTQARVQPQAPPMQAQVQAPAAIPTPPTPPQKADDSASSRDTIEAALVDVSSTPDGADIDVDGSLWGKTPSTMILTPGSHEIAIKKSGFHVWRKRFKLSSGHVNVNVELVPKAK
jgi:PEGA domain